jgi:hypothetical protein
VPGKVEARHPAGADEYVQLRRPGGEQPFQGVLGVGAVQRVRVVDDEESRGVDRGADGADEAGKVTGVGGARQRYGELVAQPRDQGGRVGVGGGRADPADRTVESVRKVGEKGGLTETGRRDNHGGVAGQLVE